ncbi:MAG: type II secretion system GspH family protein [Lentisphaeraceae bacterium]|nr:type II secretion system GspH family protein [Lentisphaeraceae bacterium]
MGRQKFTLVELLVVIAIIGILASMLLPSLQNARNLSKVAVCKSNMKQVGVAAASYMTDSPLPHPPIFRDSTADWPNEGFASHLGKAGPGNPAMWTFHYLEAHENIFFCPLVTTEKTFHKTPRVNEDDYMWGTSVYLFGKATAANDPYSHLRENDNAGGITINKVNDKSEGVMMFDIFPNARDTSSAHEHYNTLMDDGRVFEPAKTEIKMNIWLWGTTGWAGR